MIDKATINRRVGKTMFLVVMYFIVLSIADRVHPGSAKMGGALAAFVGLAVSVGGALSALLDRLFLTQLLGERRSLLVSCGTIWAVVLAYFLTMPSAAVNDNGPALRALGATIGMCVVFWFRRRRLERAAIRG